MLAVLKERFGPDVLEYTQQFAGYVLVSGTALVVDVFVYSSLLAHVGYAVAAAACGYICGVITHYLLSSRIVFRSRFSSRGVAAEAPVLVKFFAAGLSGLVVTSVVIGVLVDIMGFDPLLSKLCAAAVSFVTVFTVLRVFVFNLAVSTRPSTA